MFRSRLTTLDRGGCSCTRRLAVSPCKPADLRLGGIALEIESKREAIVIPELSEKIRPKPQLR
jgi:hypothetical protein